MDTAEILELGAKQALVRMAKDLEELLAAVPGASRFARDILREALGMQRMGRKPGIDGKAAKRLAKELAASRAAREPFTSTNDPNKLRSNGRRVGPRPRLTPAQKAEIKRRTVARWAEAHRLGYTGRNAPSNAILDKLRAKAAKAAKGKKQTSTPKPASTAADQASPATPAA